MPRRVLWGNHVLAGVGAVIAGVTGAAQPSDAVTEGIEEHQLATPARSQGNESPPAQALLLRPDVKVQRHYYRTATGASWVVPASKRAQPESSGDATGACCSIFGDCTIQTESTCADIGDSYLGDGTTCEPNECPQVVYSNTGGSMIVAPRRRRRIADDVSTVAVGGCRMPDSYVSAYEILVGVKVSELTGDRYTVEFGIWDDCPGAVPPGELIPGTAGEVELEDDGSLHLISIDLEGAGVSVPQDFWIGVRFTSDNTGLQDKAGWVAGSPAEIGFTRDCYDFPHPSLRCCCARLLVTKWYYAGFYARVHCKGDFEREFPAYLNPEVEGLVFAGGAGTWVADDVELIVDDCELSSLEVAVIGMTGTFTMDVELWSRTCDKTALIEGSQRTYTGRGDGCVEVARFTYLDEQDHGLDIGGDIWLGWKFDKAGVGAIVAEEPTLGDSEDLFGILDEYLDCGLYWFGGNPYAAFNATFRCIGDPPRGACCDLADSDGDGEYCRDSTELGCPGPFARWSEGETCDNFDAFDPPCGYSACCVPPVNPHMGGEGCIDLPAYEFPCAGDSDCPNGDCDQEMGSCETGEGCLEISDDQGHPAVWYRGSFCEMEPLRDCIYWCCRYGMGSCYEPHPWPCCDDPWCCDHICSELGSAGRYCCAYEWDAACASIAQDYCYPPPLPDQCVDAAALTRDIACWNTQPVGLGPEDPLCYRQSNVRATISDDDPGFCCHPAGAGTKGVGSLWYTFVAEAETVDISTCTSETGEDCLVEVYSVKDPSTPETACTTLTPIACMDDGGCGSQPGNNRVKVYGLNVGETYYIQLASKTAATTGKYRVLVRAVPDGRCTDGVTACNTTAQDCPESVAPCEFHSAPPAPPSNSYCAHAIQASTGIGTAFDLEHAHMDCPIELSLPRMQNDVWFRFFTMTPGLHVATTCPQSGPGPDTTLALYAGDGDEPVIDCPVDPDNRVAANDDWCGQCGSGSRVTWAIDATVEYMIRIGGENGSEPSGTLTVTRHDDCNENMIPDSCDIDCDHPDMWTGACRYMGCGQSPDCQANGIPDECECPDGGVVGFDNPPDGFLDARQPHTVDDPIALQGVETFGVVADRYACSRGCWSALETSVNPDLHPGITPPNGITSVEHNGDGTCGLTLERAIAHGEVTTLIYESQMGATTVAGTFTYHPGDANGDGLSASADIDAVIDSLDEEAPLPLERCDMDRDGQCGPGDILRLIDLLNGAAAFEPWLDR